jgi:prevent-host-death family protein
MTAYSVAAAKNALSRLIDQALDGEEVVITRHGKPVVEIRPAAGRPPRPIGSDAWLDARRGILPSVGITSVELLNLIYESDEE